MFALEISFQDGVSQPEMIFIRRPQALIGASDYAHVVVEDLKELGCQLRLVRELGRRFRLKMVGKQEAVQKLTDLEGSYEGEAALDLGNVRLFVTALDADLMVKDGEPPDRAGVRIMRQTAAITGPLFPAIVVCGNNPMVISFVPDQPIYIGRSKQCALRLDSADISARHSRMGYENGEFWIEDLGSTNGTFVNGQQISGRVSVSAGVPIILGREISILGVTSEDQILRATRATGEEERRVTSKEQTYPVLLSVSEVARPARLVLSQGVSVNVGRDPGSDMWLGAPHVSRRHCSFSLEESGSIAVTDHSTNGTAYDQGILKRGDTLEIREEPRIFDFGGGVTVAVCFNEEQERQFAASQGAPLTFRGGNSPAPRPSPGAQSDRGTREFIPGEEGLDFNSGEMNYDGIPHETFMQMLWRRYRTGGTKSQLLVYGAVTLLAVVMVLVGSLLVELMS